MRITNTNKNIGYEGESYSREITYEIDDNLLDCDIYFEFDKTSTNKKYVSQKLDLENKKYLLPYGLIDKMGYLKVQMVAYRGSEFIKKSDVYTFYISKSINAKEELIEEEFENLYEAFNNSKADDISLVDNSIIQLMANGKPIGTRIALKHAISLSLDQSTGTLDLNGYNENGEFVVLSQVDFPTEKILTNVYIDESKNELVMEFINHQSVRLDLGDVFKANNYYNKNEIDNLLGDINTVLDTLNGEVL